MLSVHIYLDDSWSARALWVRISKTMILSRAGNVMGCHSTIEYKIQKCLNIQQANQTRHHYPRSGTMSSSSSTVDIRERLAVAFLEAVAFGAGDLDVRALTLPPRVDFDDEAAAWLGWIYTFACSGEARAGEYSCQRNKRQKNGGIYTGFSFILLALEIDRGGACCQDRLG